MALEQGGNAANGFACSEKMKRIVSPKATACVGIYVSI
jgi:hypothetical protein